MLVGYKNLNSSISWLSPLFFENISFIERKKTDLYQELGLQARDLRFQHLMSITTRNNRIIMRMEVKDFILSTFLLQSSKSYFLVILIDPISAKSQCLIICSFFLKHWPAFRVQLKSVLLKLWHWRTRFSNFHPLWSNTFMAVKRTMTVIPNENFKH